MEAHQFTPTIRVQEAHRTHQHQCHHSGIDQSQTKLDWIISGIYLLEGICKNPQIENLPQEPVQVGGIVLWQDDHHFFRFERGLFGPNELRFGYVNEKEDEKRTRMIRIGRGFLSAKSYRLRLERMGKLVRALVKGDKEQWLSCGEYETSLRDLLSVGFYALCPDILSEFYPIDVTQARLWVKEFRTKALRIHLAKTNL